MLHLKRKIGQRILLDNGIVITLKGISSGHASISIDAPPNIKIFREELLTDIQRSKLMIRK